MEKASSGNIVYEDKLVRLSATDICLFRFHFPLGTSKTVPFASIDRIEEFPATLETGSMRLWGSGDFKTWFPLDAKRASRKTIFIIHLRTSRKRYGFTVENEDAFREAMSSLGVAIQSGSQETIREGNSFALGITAVILLAIGVFFVVSSVLFIAGKISPNGCFGIRIAATLKSEQVWYATHVFAGWVFLVLGLLIMGFGGFMWKKRGELAPAMALVSFYLIFPLVMLAVGACLVYAAIISK